jgi:hypothetical protein
VGCLLPIAGGVLIVLILVHCCCHVGCLLLIAGWDQGKKKNVGKKISPSEKPMLMRRGADKGRKTREKPKKKGDVRNGEDYGEASG